MRRRRLLGATAAALSAAVAGCTSAGGDDPEPTESTQTTSPTTTTRRSSGASTAVSDVVLQPAALQLNTDYLTVYDAGQYLFARADVEAGSAPAAEFGLRFAGETYRPLAGSARRQLWRAYGEEYDPESGGLLAFELPGSADADDPEAVLTHPGGERDLDAGLRTRLAGDPEFSFDVSVPDTVAADGTLSVAVAVTNEGDAPARFVGGLNRSGPMIAMKPVEGIRPLVPAGESTTLAIDQSEVPSDTPDDEVGDGDPDAEFTLHTVAGSEERSVRVVEST